MHFVVLSVLRKSFWTLGFVFVLASCASQPTNPQLTLMSESEFETAVESQTHNQKIYDGFVNTMDVTATLHTDNVVRALLDQGARIYQWDSTQYAKEKALVDSAHNTQTEFFLSFFVPERKWDDLHKTTTKWKIFLDVNGKRFEGKATRWKANLAEVQSFYPHHTRWGTPYKILFPVPTRDIQDAASRLTITGPVGVIQLDFTGDQK